MKNSILTKATTAVTKTAQKTKLKAMKHSPDIFIGIGIVGVIGSAVIACKKTLELPDILEEKRTKINEINDFVEKNGYSEEYGEKEHKQEISLTYLKMAGKIAKLYAPAVILGSFSIAAILTSHNIMRKRNANLAAAYATLYTGFKEYRERVAERFGEDVEKEIRYGIKKEEIEEETTTKNGKKKVEKKVVESYDPNKLSPYAVVFDDGCTGWTKDPEWNKQFLLKQQAFANQKLKSRGFLFLNEVYKMLGFEQTKDGHIVGWVYDEKHPVGDNFVDFGIYDIDKEANRRFVNGLERNIILDFNVDGNILNLI